MLDGTEQPIEGARLLLTPIAPLPHVRRGDALEAPHELLGEALSGPSGAFAIGEVTGPDGRPRSLPRGWEYELRAEAPGFFSTTDRVDFERGEQAVVLEIVVIEDEVVQGSGGVFIGEAPPGRVDDMRGTLVDEVLRRMGREPPEGRPDR